MFVTEGAVSLGKAFSLASLASLASQTEMSTHGCHYQFSTKFLLRLSFLMCNKIKA